MHTLYRILKGLRNVYITIMFLPMWIWSALYRVGPELGWTSWLLSQWGLYSLLTLFYGAGSLWFFIELAVKAQYAGEKTKGLWAAVWAVSLSLFVGCLGAIIDQGQNGWGRGLFLLGFNVLPLAVLYSTFFLGHKEQEREEQQAQQSVTTDQ